MRPLVLCILLALAGCSNGHWLPPVAGRSGPRVLPELFAFGDIISAPPDGSIGGWRAVCIHAAIGQGNPGQPAGSRGSGVCKLEVGVPIVNVYGYVDRRRAQQKAAEAANKAAYFVLERVDMAYVPSAQVCSMIKEEMNFRLKLEIAGSEVSVCGATRSRRNVLVVTWP